VSKRAAWGWIVAILLVVTVAYQIYKRRPPFERGVHDSVVQAQANPAHSDSPHIGPCPVLPADNVWNTPIDTLPVDRHSKDYASSIGPTHGIHPDFGSNLNSGMPFSELKPGTRRVRVDFDYREESDLGNYPIPPDAPIEGGTNSTADRHIILIDLRTCILYEIFDTHPLPDGAWKAGSGVKIDLTDNALRPSGWTSADAAGLPVFPGLVRYDEVLTGEINHALRFTVPQTQNTFIWPARHKASKLADVTVPPMGARFRLRADFDISKFSKTNQIILRCLKRYGMFVADNGGSMFVTGVGDKRWDDSDLHKLGDVKADDFEAVDESDLQLLADSGRVDPTVVKH
jgi:hypothetical protein